MSGRRSGYRSQRRPRVETTCSTTRTFETMAAAVAAAPQPIDCPSCNGTGRGCGTCGGLGFLGHEEWRIAVQRVFVAAAGLVLPCEADGDGEAA